MDNITINEDNAGQRIDKFLTEHLGITRVLSQKMNTTDLILVNDAKVKNNYKLQINDVVQIVAEYEDEEIELIPQDLNLDIIYEDEDVILVNKPSGMVVHPAAGNPDGTLVNGLLFHAQKLSSKGEDFRPGIVHRIDKDTSGILMVAKNNIAHESLSKQLKDKTAFRKYLAIVHGVIKEDFAKIDAPLGRDKIFRQKMCVTSQNSKVAVTNVTVMERFKDYTLISCQLETGRTHQIRVHMSYINHPIVGDPVYGRKRSLDTKGQALHAQTLGFTHPTTGKYMEFSVEPPEEFGNTLRKVEGE